MISRTITDRLVLVEKILHISCGVHQYPQFLNPFHTSLLCITLIPSRGTSLNIRPNLCCSVLLHQVSQRFSDWSSVYYRLSKAQLTASRLLPSQLHS